MKKYSYQRADGSLVIFYKDWRGRWRCYDDFRDEPTLLGLPRGDWPKVIALSLLCAL